MEWKPTPTVKAPELESLISAITGVDRRKAITTKSCATCGRDVTLNMFDDQLSLKEFHISGMCQTCQDKVFG